MTGVCLEQYFILFYIILIIYFICFYFFIQLCLALAEILSIKENSNGETHYYIHYIDYNKRLDEWVTKDRLDLHKMQLPKKDIKTPLKNGSRPSSPERELVFIRSFYFFILIIIL